MKETKTIVTGAIAALAGFGGGTALDRTVEVTPADVGAMVQSLAPAQADAADAVLLRGALNDALKRQKELTAVIDTYRQAQPTIANMRSDQEACEEAVRHYEETNRTLQARYSTLLNKLNQREEEIFDTNELPQK